MRRTFALSLVTGLAVLVAASQPSARQLPPFGGAAAYVADLAARRAKVMETLGPDTVLVLWAAPERVYSTDVNYEYRQESNFLYLTGFGEAEAMLVLVPGATTAREFLFIRAGDARRELWNGHVPSVAEASAATGIKNVLVAASFPAFMNGLFSMTPAADQSADNFAPFYAAVRESRAKIAVMGGGAPGGRRGGGGAGAGAAPAAVVAPAPMPGPPAAPGTPRAFADDIHARYPGVTSINATQTVEAQRQLKTPYEQQVLRHSAEISAEAHIEGMRAAKPGRWEYEVEAAIEYWYLKNGAMSWGYPSIVGSGPNATTLHYEKSTRQMKDGELLLVDAAANFQGITADITRTYPISGKFTADQRAIYELVLAGQEAGIAVAKAGARSADITRAIRDVFGDGLFKLGLITESAPGAARDAQVGRWFPHGPTHGIGIDVHDPLGVFAPGSAFTIEPGLYIRQDTLDNLPKTPENTAFVTAVQPAVNRFKNIGVRIEDSFLVTESGVVNLSAKAPRKVADIEKIVGTAK